MTLFRTAIVLALLLCLFPQANARASGYSYVGRLRLHESGQYQLEHNYGVHRLSWHDCLSVWSLRNRLGCNVQIWGTWKYCYRGYWFFEVYRIRSTY